MPGKIISRGKFLSLKYKFVTFPLLPLLALGLWWSTRLITASSIKYCSNVLLSWRLVTINFYLKPLRKHSLCLPEFTCIGNVGIYCLKIINFTRSYNSTTFHITWRRHHITWRQYRNRILKHLMCFYLKKRFAHFRSMFPFYTPWKRYKTSGFLMFSAGIERKHWPEMG